ncbi:MAG: shikimate kinase, partial [Desulfatirhabdiaceae bacterium]|nr:shikimate kinase [Desulfatirhabdiaceae bacterium]
MNIYLIGYRCCGKTSVGRSLSKILDRPFLDTDAAVVDIAKMTICEMVDRYGWDAFRNLEKSVIDRSILLNRYV